MFESRRLNSKINNAHEKALRTIYSDYKSTFQELLHKDASFSVQHKNIQTFAIEIYKHIHGLSPEIMGEVFKINRTLPYNLRTQNHFSSRVPKTVKCGTKTIYFLAPKVWAFVPEKRKECSCLEAFKSKLGNGNRIVHVGYAKLTCNTLGFFKYVHNYTSIQMHILSLYICNDNSDCFLLSRYFIHTDDAVSLTLQYLHKNHNILLAFQVHLL